MRRAGLIAFTLVLGGLALLGAMAGARLSFAIVIGSFGCGVPTLSMQPEACSHAASTLNNMLKLFLVAGVVSMFSGGFVLWRLNNA